MSVSVNLANQALLRIGADTITAITDESLSAEKVALVYDYVVDLVLSEHDFPCARRRASLARLSEAPSHEFAYQYALPGDCLRIIEVYGATSPYVREGNKLLTNDTSVKINYVARLSQESEMDPFLKNVIVYELANLLAMPLTQDKQVKREILAELQLVIKNAEAAGALQDSARQIQGSTIWEDS